MIGDMKKIINLLKIECINAKYASIIMAGGLNITWKIT